MDPARNPYAPGAGRPPVALVGRDAELEAWRVGLERIERGLTAQPLALYGLRGVGKTVLLTRMAQDAQGRAWLTAQVEAGVGQPLRSLLGEALYGPLTDLVTPAPGKKLLRALKTALSFKASYDMTGNWSFGLDLRDVQGGGADSGVLETDVGKLVRDLSAAANDDGVGLAILIDEAQDLESTELVALCAVAHQASQQGWPFLLALAGLPSLPRNVAEAKSYAERLFAFSSIARLPAEKTAEAIRLPAARNAVEWDDDAVEEIITASRGYPYFLQQFGQDAWNAAEGPNIERIDARMGIIQGTSALDVGFFRARWDRATRAEQDYLRAMAEDDEDGSLAGDIVRRLKKKSSSSLGPTRAKLIEKGLVFAPEHGRIAFTVPGMAAFIKRQPNM